MEKNQKHHEPFTQTTELKIYVGPITVKQLWVRRQDWWRIQKARGSKWDLDFSPAFWSSWHLKLAWGAIVQSLSRLGPWATRTTANQF